MYKKYGEEVIKSHVYFYNKNHIAMHCKNKEYIICNMENKPAMAHRIFSNCIDKKSPVGDLILVEMAKMESMGWRCMNDSCENENCILYNNPYCVKI